MRLLAFALTPLLLAAAVSDPPDPEDIVRHAPLAEADRALLVDIAAIARFTKTSPPAHPGVWAKGWTAGGRLQVDYAYEPARPGEGPTVANSVSIEVDERAAKRFYARTSTALREPIEANGLTVKACGAPKWGDEARCEIYFGDGRPLGQSVFARRGRKVFLFTLFGAAFTHDAELHRLLAPRLTALDAYTPPSSEPKPAPDLRPSPTPAPKKPRRN